MEIAAVDASRCLLLCYDGHHAFMGEDPTVAETVVLSGKGQTLVVHTPGAVDIVKLLRYCISWMIPR